MFNWAAFLHIIAYSAWSELCYNGSLLDPYLAEAFEDCKKLGINVDGYKLKDLPFADDIALIAHSENDLQTLIERVHDVSKKYGMEISIPKTKAMIFSHEDQLQVNIKLDDTSLLDQVNRFKYLGVTLTPSNDSTSEIKSRLLLASTALGKLRKVWSGKDITLSTKLRLLNALVYPVLLYCSEIWTIKKNDLKKLVAFEMRCYRKVLNITWKDKIRNEDVLLRISSCKFNPKRIPARITESQLSLVWSCLQNEQHASSQTHSYGNGPWYQQTKKTKEEMGRWYRCWQHLPRGL